MTTRTSGGEPGAGIDVVMSFDDGYVGPAAVMVLGLARASVRPVQLHVIDGGLRPDRAEDFAALVRPFVAVTMYAAPDPLVLDLPEGGYNDYLSSASMRRLHVAELLPAEVRRVLYLDADLTVLGDPGDLVAADLGGCSVGAVQDVGWPRRRITITPDGRPEEFYEGATPPGYFNSGVLVIDLARWRDDDVLDRCRQLHHAVGNQLRAPDQDILNVVFDGAWAPLPAEWNRMVRPPGDPIVDEGPDERWERFVESQRGGPGTAEWRRFLQGGRGIVHYSGRCKPWLADFPDGPVKEHWYAHARTAREMTGTSADLLAAGVP